MSGFITDERKVGREALINARVSFWWRAQPIVLALVLTVGTHIATYKALPERFNFSSVSESPTARAKPADTYKIHLVKPLPPEPEPEPKQDELQNVVASPDAPQNKPDETLNFSSRDQQAAQEKPAEELDPDFIPSSEGELEESNAVTTGQMFKQTAQEIAAQLQSAQQSLTNPQKGTKDGEGEDDVDMDPPALPDVYKGEAADGKGIRSLLEVGKAPEIPDVDTKEVVIPDVVTPEVVEKQLAHREQQYQPQMQQAQVQPMPRPSLSGAMPTVLARHKPGVAATGTVAFNANFSEYGEYLDRMWEVVLTKWYDLNGYSRASVQDTRSFVRIQFYITKDGRVEDLEVLESTSSQIAELRCVDAIKAGAPYWDWTSDMVRVLGDRQVINVTFWYR